MEAVMVTERASPIDPSADAELVREAVAGDPRAFAALYERHVEAAHRLLSRLVGCVDEREDLLQEAFLRLHRALPRFRGDAQLPTFLHRIVVHVAYDFLEARRRRPASLDVTGLELVDEREPSPAQCAQRSEQLARTLGYLARLTPKRRIAYVLREVVGLTYPQIADLIGTWPPTVRMRVKLAHRQLASMIAADEEASP
jgi:RNA polymerase sigma-70 factor (ECF subfamily)